YHKANSKKRVVKWFQFGFKLLKLPTIIHSKPDVIVCSGSAPMLIIPCYFLAKKYNAKLIFQIKDIWPLTLIELGGYSKYNPLIYLMQKSVNFAFKNADMVVSLLPFVDKYIEKQGIYNYKFEYLPNGIFLEEVEQSYPLSRDVELKIPSNKFIIGYAGSMSYGDGLDILIETASRLRKYSDIHFVIVGKGVYKKNLKKLMHKLQLNNITFIEPIPKKEIQNLLKSFDICYLGWKDKKIYEYGISANKIFDYMYAKKPILHLYSGKGDLISEANCGITVTKEDSTILMNAILELYNCSKENRELMGERGHEFVLKYHTYDAISKKFIKICQNLINSSISSHNKEYVHL
ncbi:MAG: glycosyltransferase family 4 protein, partial [Sulfurovaceae bacterium]|nr:glycosyltransferase family 4 protein [Sulfurovaceae bacterium]